MDMLTKHKVMSLCCYLCLLSVRGDSVMNPQFEYRRMPGDIGPNPLSFPNSNFPSRANHMTQQQTINTGRMNSQPPLPSAENVQHKNSSYTYEEFLNAMREFAGDFGVSEEENQKSRSSNVASEKQSEQLPHDFSRQNFDPWTQTIQESASSYAPIKIGQQPSIKALPKFNLLEPITTKISSKISGLMGFILALLGNGSDNIFLNGFKEVLINGILKPLFVIKGGLKVLISKLLVPIIALVLINLEVLITVWWLWDDCPQLTPIHHNVYTPLSPIQSSASDSYNYNTTYR